MKKIKLIISVLLLIFMITPINVTATTSEDNDEFIVDNVEGKSVTFDQMIQELANKKNISYEESLSNYIKQKRKELPVTRSLVSDDELLKSARGWYYWEDTIYVHSAKLNYTAAIFVYYSYMGSKSNRSINKIENAGIDCTIASAYKHFGGSLYLNVETQYRYYYKLNGAFYNTGSTTVSGGLSIGIGDNATLSFGISSTSNFYDGISVSGRIVSSRNDS